jgi:hypothetical protein
MPQISQYCRRHDIHHATTRQLQLLPTGGEELDFGGGMDVHADGDSVVSNEDNNEPTDDIHNINIDNRDEEDVNEDEDDDDKDDYDSADDGFEVEIHDDGAELHDPDEEQIDDMYGVDFVHALPGAPQGGRPRDHLLVGHMRQ